jgi:hypothetical protein
VEQPFVIWRQGTTTFKQSLTKRSYMSDITPQRELAFDSARTEIISFKLTKEDLAKIGEVVTRLQVTSGIDVAQPGAFTIRNHSFNPDKPGAFTIRNHNFSTREPGAYTIRNYQFSSK